MFSAAIFVGILRLRLHSNEYLPKVDNKDFAVSYWDVFVFGARHVSGIEFLSTNILSVVFVFRFGDTHFIQKHVRFGQGRPALPRMCYRPEGSKKKCGFIKEEAGNKLASL